MIKDMVHSLKLYQTAEAKQRAAEGRKILDVYNGDIKQYTNITDFEIWPYNIFRLCLRKRRELLYRTEPNRTYPKEMETLIKKRYGNLTEIMKKIMIKIEMYGAVYIDWDETRIFAPWQIHESKEGYKIATTEDAKNVFQWVYDERQTYFFRDGEKTSQKENFYGLKKYNKFEENNLLHEAEMQIEYTKIATILKESYKVGLSAHGTTTDLELTQKDIYPGSMHLLEEGQTYKTHSYEVPMQSALLVFEEYKQNLHNTLGIPEVTITGDAKSFSAKHLYAKWLPVIETYNALAQEYSIIEKKIIEDLEGVQIDEADYNVAYDTQQLTLLTQESEDINFELRNNLTTLRDLLRRKYPALTENEIDEKLKSNIKENKENRPKLDDEKPE